MKKKIYYFLLAIFMLPAMFFMVGCGDKEKDKDNDTDDSKVPVYTGMQIVDNSEIPQVSAMSYSAEAYSAGHSHSRNDRYEQIYNYENHKYHGDYNGNNGTINQEKPFGKEEQNGDQTEPPTIEDEIKDTFNIIGAEQDRYYAVAEEIINVKVLFDNPDQFEIMSFTINNTKYQVGSDRFIVGLNGSYVIAKVYVGEETGLKDLTIDAIKYIDGERIRNVKMDGEKTISVGVRGENEPQATVSNESILLTSIEFDVNLVDGYGLIEKDKGYAKAYLYNGETILENKVQNLSVGDNHVKFDGLNPNTIYQYAICVVYDDSVVDSDKIFHTLYKKAFATNKIVVFDNINVTKETISFKLKWDKDFEDKTASYKLYHKETKIDTQKVANKSTETISFDHLLSNHEYVVEATYKNLNNTDETIYIVFKTGEKVVPDFEIKNETSTQTSVSFEIDITDNDNVGEVTSIKLKHKTNPQYDKTLIDLTLRTFEGLLSNNDYVIEVTYIYDLNDGTTQESIIKTQPVKTLAKVVPVIEILDVTPTQTSVSFELEITDNDSVGSITNIVLKHKTNSELNKNLPNLNLRKFENLNWNTLYTIEVTYTYNLNDGVGEQFITKLQDTTTLDSYKLTYVDYGVEHNYPIEYVLGDEIVFEKKVIAGLDCYWFDGDNKIEKINTTTTGNKTLVLKYVDNEDKVYNIVKTPSDFISIKNSLNKNHILINNIDFEQEKIDSLGGFSGYLDGNGYSILNFKNKNNNFTGIFSSNSGTIKNLGLNGFDLTVNNSFFQSGVGSLVSENSGTISNCFAIGNMSVSLEVAMIGGLAGIGGSLTNCYSNVDIYVSRATIVYVGGLVGSGNNLTNCHATGKVEVYANYSDLEPSYVGGLAGRLTTATNCYATGNVIGSAYFGFTAGGLVGYCGTIKNCYSTGNVTSKGHGINKVGGLAGSASSIYNSYANSIVTIEDATFITYGGGLASQASYIENCYVQGELNIVVKDNNGNGEIYFGAISAIISNEVKNSIALNIVDVNFNTYKDSFYIINAGYVSSNGNVENCYILGGEQFIVNPENASAGLWLENGIIEEVTNFKSETFLTETIGFGKYVSEEDLKTNPNNVWVFENGEYPKLYFQN